MNREQLANGFLEVISEIFEPEAYFGRLDDLYIWAVFMINIRDRGKNNRVIIHESYQIADFDLTIEGHNNEIFFDSPLHVAPGDAVQIAVFGSGNRIGAGAIYRRNLKIHCINGFRCAIGDRSSFQELNIAANEPSSVTIGKDCLFALNVKVYPTDFHKILSGGVRINEPRPITIGNKVWLCEGVIVLSGATIGDGCVIGAGAVVSKRIPQRSVAVGNPAHVIRSDIEWEP
jgi:acetyltransferase-like isoleucine patch superfamily enzyme